MKREMQIFMMLLAVVGCSFSVHGGIPILYSGGEKIEKVKELPLWEELQIQASDGCWYHADLGILHEQFSIFYIPLVNYGTETYVLFANEKVGDYDATFCELDEETLSYLQSEIGGIPTVSQLPF